MFEAIEQAVATKLATRDAGDRDAWIGQRREDRAYQDGIALYGSVLLPAIFPGTAWKSNDKGYPMLTSCRFGYRPVRCPDSDTLFDHPLYFRRHGARGPTTWDNTIIIGQPYGLASVSMATIDWLANKIIGVWRREDLSMWNPPSTVLVLAARGLDDMRAADFGFESVTLASERKFRLLSDL